MSELRNLKHGAKVQRVSGDAPQPGHVIAVGKHTITILWEDVGRAEQIELKDAVNIEAVE